jgi:hypothetical protein
MTYVQLVFHIANLFLFILAFFIWITVRKRILLLRIAPLFKGTGLAVVYSVLFLSILFVYLQIDWILSSHNEAVGDFTSYVWLLWDYFLVIFVCVLGLWSKLAIDLYEESWICGERDDLIM